MVEEKTLIHYFCPECGLHYEDKDTVEKCEKWCQEHQSCNLEIIDKAAPEESSFI